jgi:hypothetical protein
MLTGGHRIKLAIGERERDGISLDGFDRFELE